MEIRIRVIELRENRIVSTMLSMVQEDSIQENYHVDDDDDDDDYRFDYLRKNL